MSKVAAAVVAFAALFLCSVPMSAQFNGLLPSGNVYGGVSYAQITNFINQQSYRGWNASFEALPFVRFPRLGLVADGGGFYRRGETEYDVAGGPRLSANMGKWRPFIHGMAGIRHLNSSGITYRPLLIDVGGGVDYKLWLKNFSLRMQGDFMHSHYASAYQNDYRASTGFVWRF